MIARASAPARPASAALPAMVGNRRPQPHRFHFVHGRVLEGNLHRSPTIRLADHLATQKGMISVTDATCVQSGERYPYLVVNLDQVMFIEELAAPDEPSGPQLG